MSQRVVELDRLNEYNEGVARTRQKLFEAAGGQGSVDDFIVRGASDEGFETMSPPEQQQYLNFVSVEAPVQIKDVMKGQIRHPHGNIYQRQSQP